MEKIKRLVVVCTIGILMAFTTSSNSKKLTDNAIVIKNNDLQVINAAVKHPTNGRTHFFVGKYFHMYNTTTRKLERIGLIGKDGWYGLPSNVDAALIHPINKKAYIFKGNMYYRYDFTKKKVDKRGIVGVDGWKGLNGPFDAVMVHPTNNRAYFFKGNKYHRYNFSTKKREPIRTIGKDGWKGIPGTLDAIVMHKNGSAYAFKEDHYYRYVFGKKVDKKGVIGRDGWKLFHRLDAAVFNDFDKNNFNVGDIHLIRGSYGYYVENEDIGGYVKIIQPRSKTQNVAKKRNFGRDWYKGTPPNVDAGIYHPIKKKYYFFKEEKYYRYDPKTRKIDKTGVIGKDGWSGIPINLDAAFFHQNESEVYFFRDTKIFVFDVKKNKRTFYGEISDRFKDVPNFIDAAGYDKVRIWFFKKDRAYYSNLQGKGLKVETIPTGFFK